MKRLAKSLQPHQREAVNFLWRIAVAQRGCKGGEGVSGVILADEMGLGKTLTSIAFIYAWQPRWWSCVLRPWSRTGAPSSPSGCVSF